MTGTAERLITELIQAVKQDPKKLWDLKEHKTKRTLSQNAYYWTLLGQVANALKMPHVELHNRMLRQAAPVEVYGGKVAFVVLPDTDETEEKALRSETVHLRPTQQTKVLADGVRYRTYNLLRGSSDMTTEEMVALLDKLIIEAKQLGIETMRPQELAEMRRREAEREKKHHNEP